jgi:hypothetical protein
MLAKFYTLRCERRDKERGSSFVHRVGIRDNCLGMRVIQKQRSSGMRIALRFSPENFLNMVRLSIVVLHIS